MSSDEMREYCLSVSSFRLRVQVRLKNGQEIMTGRIAGVEAERFQLVCDNADEAQTLRYAWVARITNA